ncbi:hypothetical protein, partial [Pseudomonas syringae]|uniref:hypothetical protein n=1 Tax=Pseudomonas syringae TaxID=317 RepID=UPI001E519F4B
VIDIGRTAFVAIYFGALLNAGCLYKQTSSLDCTQALSVIGYPRRRRSTGFYRFQALEPSACMIPTVRSEVLALFRGGFSVS